MSDFRTSSLRYEMVAAKWKKHAQSGDIRSQSMKLPQTTTDTETDRTTASQSMRIHTEYKAGYEQLPQTKTKAETDKPIASQSMMEHRQSKKGYEQDSGSMVSEELSRLAPYPPISGSDLKLIPNPSGKEVVDEERRKSAN